MLKLYHNPRCSKSREAKQLLDEKGLKYETIEYIKNPISIAELQEIVRKLSIEPIELVRQKEAIWKENYKGKDLSDDEILEAMIEHPRLMERPIVVHNEKAIVGRQIGLKYETIEYIKNPISIAELQEIVRKLSIEPIELVRQKEAIWKENYKGKDLSDDEILEAMIEHPRLMERPIVVHNEKAIVGRPASLILDIL